LGEFDFLAIALFSAELRRVRQAAVPVLAEHFGVGGFALEARPLEVSRIYVRRPPRGGAHAIRAVMFEPQSAPKTTAMITNLADGWLTLCNVLAEHVTELQVLARTSIDREYPLTDFQVWQDGHSVRYVRSMRDNPSWEFYARGTPLGFEEPNRYRARRIRDRLTRDSLVAYLRKLGWDLEDSGFGVARLPAEYLTEHHRS
jgi:hypothetical protein